MQTMMSFFLSYPVKNSLNRWWWSIDRINLSLIMFLIVLGIVMIGTSSPSVANRIGMGSSHQFLIKHLIFLVPSLCALVCLSFIRIKNIPTAGIIIFTIAAAGVVATLFQGSEIKGATRWVSLMGFAFQPSEFLKPGFVILSAWFLARQKQDDSFPGFLIAGTLYVLCIILLMSQPDFGMSFVITLVFAMQFFLFGCRLRYVVFLSGLLILAMVAAYFTMDHVKSRFDRHLFSDAGDTYQIDKSKEAFINGGILGKGLGQGTVKNHVPDVHADFIFTAIGEEFGFLLTSMIVGIFALLYYRFFSKFIIAQSVFVMLAGSGLTFMLMVQSFIHMGSALQLIPAKGMTLPLVSYGGSSLISVCIALGFLLALSRGIQDDRRRATWRHLVKKSV